MDHRIAVKQPYKRVELDGEHFSYPIKTRSMKESGKKNVIEPQMKTGDLRRWSLQLKSPEGRTKERYGETPIHHV